jgi:diguanylate cyclase (GGDEF)-like protein
MQKFLEDLIENRGTRPRILVVDDQIINIHIVHELFKDEYDVIMAINGEQAIIQCESQNPDIILLDVVMDGMSGHEVCRQLKAKSITQSIPIIFLTSQHNEEDEALGFELGAVDFITKPINKTVVRARIRTHLTLKLQTDWLKSIALIDGLTGVANRRRYDEYLQTQWSQCARDNQPLSILMIDVDYFKRYNDCYGHQKGDEALQQIAQKINSVLRRPSDLVARYGGEEFVCLLPNTNAVGAKKIADQVLNAIRDLNIEHILSGVEDRVTVSIGVSTQIAAANFSAIELNQAADKQLYESKKLGRARVTAIELI